jgi:hypothetical protein
MKLFSFLVALGMSVGLASAQERPLGSILDGTAPLIVWPGKDPDQNRAEIRYCKPDQISANDKWIPFVPVDGDWVAQNYSFNAGGMIHVPPVAPVDTTRDELAAQMKTAADNDKVTDEQFAKMVRIQQMSDKSKRDTAWADLKGDLQDAGVAVEAVSK